MSQVTGGHGVKLSAEKSRQPVYSYVYAHRGAVTLADLVAFPVHKLALKKAASYLFGLDWLYSLSGRGPCHSDEIFLQFKFHALPFDARGRPEDRRMGQKLVEWWANFARCGDPTPDTGEWKW